MEKWWEEEGYLRPRYPITPYVNIGGPVSTNSIWLPQEGTQINRSAILTNALLQLWKQIYKLVGTSGFEITASQQTMDGQN